MFDDDDPPTITVKLEGDFREKLADLIDERIREHARETSARRFRVDEELE